MASRSLQAVLAAGLAACAVLGSGSDPPERFASPQAGANALVAALEADDQAAIMRVLGREYSPQIVTPDWQAERPMRERIAAAARAKLELNPLADGREEIVLGDDEWPFPILLERSEDGSWHFDTSEGVEVIVDRRIGRNELAAIAICDAYVDAQIAYARENHDGDGVFAYAQRLASTPGTQNGLYWKTGPGEPESPFGPLVTGAEAYLATRQPGDPIRGYYFRVLDRQGPNAPGGAYEYIAGGKLVRGFGLVAYPADPGNSGIMTFVVNQAGKIYQKDLGADGAEVDSFDPDASWTLVAQTDAG